MSNDWRLDLISSDSRGRLVHPRTGTATYNPFKLARIVRSSAASSDSTDANYLKILIDIIAHELDVTVAPHVAESIGEKLFDAANNYIGHGPDD